MGPADIARPTNERTPIVLTFIGNPPVHRPRLGRRCYFTDPIPAHRAQVSKLASYRRKWRNENQICREQSRASFLAPGGLDSKTGACSKALSAGMSAYKRIEGVTGWRGGRLALAERASAAAPEFCAWQQARSPADEGTGQFAPQQGALIDTAPCAIPQAKPACNATRSASNANIPFFTGAKLISSTVRCNGLDLSHALPRWESLHRALAACKMQQ